MSRRIEDAGTPDVVASAATTLPNPPTVWGVIPASWMNVSAGNVGAFDLNLWANAAQVLTATQLLAAKLRAVTIADDDVESVTHGSDLLTIVAHGLFTGDGPIRFTTTTTLPAGLSLATDYWVIKIDADTFKVATSFANAMAGTVVDLTSAGTGTHTLADVATTKRVHWQSCGALAAGDITLGAQQGYSVRILRTPGVVAYTVAATLSTGAGVSIDMEEVISR